jgi:hypothetical protein
LRHHQKLKKKNNGGFTSIGKYNENDQTKRHGRDPESEIRSTSKGRNVFQSILEILLGDEFLHRANKRLATRISWARSKEKKLEGFDFSFNSKLPAAYIPELATCQLIERKESVILLRPAHMIILTGKDLEKEVTRV